MLRQPQRSLMPGPLQDWKSSRCCTGRIRPHSDTSRQARRAAGACPGPFLCDLLPAGEEGPSRARQLPVPLCSSSLAGHCAKPLTCLLLPLLLELFSLTRLGCRSPLLLLWLFHPARCRPWRQRQASGEASTGPWPGRRPPSQAQSGAQPETAGGGGPGRRRASSVVSAGRFMTSPEKKRSEDERGALPRWECHPACGRRVSELLSVI